MTLEITIDWLSVTFKGGSSNEKKFVDAFATHQVFDPTSARFGYDGATKSEEGVIHMWNGNREEMGHHFQFNGSSLRYILKNYGVQPQEVVRQAVHAGGRVTRLDVAKDEKSQAVDYDKIWTELLARRYTGTMRRPTRTQSGAQGYTIYMGSRQSDKFARLYNKAAEQAVQGVWNRYELELKGDVARNMSKFIADNGDLVAMFDTITKGMVTLDASWLLEMFYDNGSIKVALPKLEKVTDTEKWIAQQVTPAIAKYFQEHLDSDAIKALRDILDFIAASRLVQYTQTDTEPDQKW